MGERELREYRQHDAFNEYLNGSDTAKYISRILLPSHAILVFYVNFETLNYIHNEWAGGI